MRHSIFGIPLYRANKMPHPLIDTSPALMPLLPCAPWQRKRSRDRRVLMMVAHDNAAAVPDSDADYYRQAAPS